MNSSDLSHYQPAIEQGLRNLPGALSGHHWAALWAWQDFFTFDFELIDGCWCVFARNEVGSFLYWPPLGDFSATTLDQCCARMQEVNHGGGVTRIEHVSQAMCTRLESLGYSVDLKGYEIVYERSRITDLRGLLLKGKRNAYNAFAGSDGHTMQPYAIEFLPQCLDLYDRWSASRREKYNDPIYCHMLDENRRAHARLLEQAPALGLTGWVVIKDDLLVGYTLGYPLKEETFCVVLEIADLAFKGLAIYMFREFCRRLTDYRWINVMDDFGMPNVHQTKCSFGVDLRVPVYTASPLNKERSG